MPCVVKTARIRSCEIELELLEGPASSLFDVALALQADLPLRRRLPARRNGASACSSNRRCSRCGQGARLCFPACVRRRLSSRWRWTALASCSATRPAPCRRGSRIRASGARGDPPSALGAAPVGAAVAPGFRAAFSPRWRDLAQLLGQARNLDVFVTETLPPMLAAFPETPALAGLRRSSPSGAASNGIARSGQLSRHLNSRPWCFHSRRRSVPCPRM